jgi:hypothetical protein
MIPDSNEEPSDDQVEAQAHIEAHEAQADAEARRPQGQLECRSIRGGKVPTLNAP